MVTGDSERFVRWQGISIEQLGYAVNLLLGLAVGGAAFAAHLLVSGDLTARSAAERTVLIAAAVLLVSAGFGLWCVLNRLADFRQTMKTARSVQKGESKEERAEPRQRSGSLGKRTWRLLWAQSLSFGAGIVLLIVGVALHVCAP